MRAKGFPQTIRLVFVRINTGFLSRKAKLYEYQQVDLKCST